MPQVVVKRACDSCRTRKVKCNGEAPCDTCSKGSTRCAYDRPVRPKGPVPKLKAAKTARAHASPYPRTRSNRNSPSRFSNNYTFDLSPWTYDAPSTSYTPHNGRSARGSLTGAGHSDIFPTHVEAGNVNTVPLNPFDDDDVNGALDLVHQPPPIPSSDLDTIYLPPISDSRRPPPYPDMTTARDPFHSETEGSLALWRTPIEYPSDISPILVLTLDTLIRPQLEIYFERIYPMIPIFTRAEIFTRLNTPAYSQSEPFVAMILSMAALSLIHPLHPDEVAFRHTRAKQSKLLMDEACRLRSKWDHGCAPTVEGILTSYHMFGALFELGKAGGSRMRLREAISMGEAMRLDKAGSFRFMGSEETNRRMKLFWILSITERAHALQRSGHLVFDGPISSEPEGIIIDSSGNHLRLLSKVFTYLDQNLIHCWNNRCNPTTCSVINRETIVDSLRHLSGSADKVFGDTAALQSLNEAQQADLLITWQWVRNRIWKIGYNHGFATEDAEPELAVDHVVEVASNAVAICQRLSLPSMEAHGTGFVEKLYDMASIVTDLLQGGDAQAEALGVVQTEKWTETLQALSDLISRHRAGVDFTGQMAGVKAFVSNINLLLTPASLESLGL